jgi:hypothetical protein
MTELGMICPGAKPPPIITEIDRADSLSGSSLDGSNGCAGYWRSTFPLTVQWHELRDNRQGKFSNGGMSHDG